MNQKYLELLRHKIALNEDLLVTLEALLQNPFACSPYRMKKCVPNDFDFDRLNDYLYVVKLIDDSNMMITLLGGVYTQEDIDNFTALIEEESHNNVMVKKVTLNANTIKNIVQNKESKI